MLRLGSNGLCYSVLLYTLYSKYKQRTHEYDQKI